MKLPNGFGSVTKLSGNRRKPFAVRKWMSGKQIYAGSFETYELAIAFLINSQKSHSAIGIKRMTFIEVYRQMAAEKYGDLAENSVKNYEAALRHCELLFNKPLCEIKLSDLQKVISQMDAQKIGYASQRKCRSLFHNVYGYAIKYEIVDVDYSQWVEICKRVVLHPKKPFNRRQLNRVIALAEGDGALARWAKCVVMLCYNGCRAGEFLSIKKTDVKLGQKFFIVRESKTESGRNRIVPIHKKLLPYYQWWYEQEGSTLISENGEPVTYQRFKALFDRVMKISHCHHSPHECRHTLATWLDDAGANEVATKKILGHSVKGITKGVYTHKNLHELRKAINKVK